MKKPIRISAGDLKKLKHLCAQFPEATVEATYDHHTLRVRKKVFAYQTNDHHGDGMVSLLVKAAPGVQQTLVELDPKRFYVPPYVGPRGWVGIRLDVGKVDWKGVESMLRDSYQLCAPKKLAAAITRWPAA